MADEVPKLDPALAAIRDDPRMKDATGERVGGEPVDELEHFYVCKACGQPVDMRDLAAVFHHEERGHEPLPWEDAERLVRISARLNEALEQRR